MEIENKTNSDVENAVASLKVVKTASKKSKKTVQKKKKYAKLVITFPKHTFSISDLQEEYKKAVNITLRHRINQAKESGEVVEVGKNITNLGRPTLLFCTTPVTKEMLSGLNKNVVLNSEYDAMVKGTTVSVAKFKHRPNPVQSVTLPSVTKTVTTEAEIAAL